MLNLMNGSTSSNPAQYELHSELYRDIAMLETAAAPHLIAPWPTFRGGSTIMNQ